MSRITVMRGGQPTIPKDRIKEAAEKLAMYEENEETHDLKIYPKYFEPVIYGRKKFEIRKDDRSFKVGDVVILKEFKFPNGYTGRSITVEISYILRNVKDFGLADGYCIFGWE